MSQEEKRQRPRTRIQDLEPPAEELSEEEASRVAGGAISRIEARFPSLTTEATRVANTCTAGDALSGSDTDYGND